MDTEPPWMGLAHFISLLFTHLGWLIDPCNEIYESERDSWWVRVIVCSWNPTRWTELLSCGERRGCRGHRGRVPPACDPCTLLASVKKLYGYYLPPSGSTIIKLGNNEVLRPNNFQTYCLLFLSLRSSLHFVVSPISACAIHSLLSAIYILNSVSFRSMIFVGLLCSIDGWTTFLPSLSRNAPTRWNAPYMQMMEQCGWWDKIYKKSQRECGRPYNPLKTGLTYGDTKTVNCHEFHKEEKPLLPSPLIKFNSSKIYKYTQVSMNDPRKKLCWTKHKHAQGKMPKRS